MFLHLPLWASPSLSSDFSGPSIKKTRAAHLRGAISKSNLRKAPPTLIDESTPPGFIVAGIRFLGCASRAPLSPFCGNGHFPVSISESSDPVAREGLDTYNSSSRCPWGR